MIKVGVVGLGVMGQHHVRLYSQLNCQLVGVADIDPGRAQEIGEKYHTKFYSDYRELINRVDAVSIAVPTTMHYDVAMDFLEQGIHCLVEKPIAFKLVEAQSMIAAATQNNAKLGIGHIERFNPAVLKLKQILDSGTLGQILIISTRRVGPLAPRIQDVGVIIDSATHDIGVVKYLIGRNPVSVYSRVGSLNHLKEDHAIIVLDFESATACIEVNWFTPHKVRTLVATGSEGICYLDYLDQKITLDNSHNVEVAEIQRAEPLKLELEDFLKSLAENREPSVDGREGLEILKIALEATNNYYTSQLVLHR